MGTAWDGTATGGAGAVSVAEASFPAASTVATSGDGLVSGGSAAKGFLPAAVAGGAAADADCAETPGLVLPEASLAVAAIDAGAGVRALEFGLRFELRFELRFGLRDGPLLLGVLSRGLSATGDPLSGALAICAATVVAASVEMAGAVPSLAEANVGAASAAVGLPDMEALTPELLAVELPAVESPTLVSLDLGTAGCFVAAGWVTGARLPALTGDCSVGIDIGVGVGVEAEDVSGKMPDAEFAGGTGVELYADKGAG